MCNTNFLGKRNTLSLDCKSNIEITLSNINIISMMKFANVNFQNTVSKIKVNGIKVFFPEKNVYNCFEKI